MDKRTQAEITRIYDIKKQTLSKAIREGYIPSIQEGSKKYVDLDNLKVREYLEKKKSTVVKKLKPNNPVEKVKNIKKPLREKSDDVSSSDLDYYKTKKLKIETEILEGKYITRELVEKTIFGFIDVLTSKMLSIPRENILQILDCLEADNPQGKVINYLEGIISDGIKATKKEISNSLK